VSGSRRLKLRVFRVVVFVVMGAFFVIPIAAMFEFSTRGNKPTDPRTLVAWQSIVTYPGLCCSASFAHPSAIVASLELAVITSLAMLILVVPTMIWVRLRVPGVSRIVEFICLLPLTIPAIVLVNGLAPVYKWVTKKKKKKKEKKEKKDSVESKEEDNKYLEEKKKKEKEK